MESNSVKTDDGELTIYSVGVVHLSVCTDINDRHKIVEAVNVLHPTGLASGGRWEISKDSTFADGHPNPCPCDQSETHQHYLMEC